jgi:hypothetical protein
MLGDTHFSLSYMGSIDRRIRSGSQTGKNIRSYLKNNLNRKGLEMWLRW